MLWLQHNTTCGWIWSLFSGVYRKTCLGVKIFVYVLLPAQNCPRIQLWVESCCVLQLNSICVKNWNDIDKTTIGCNMVYIWPWCSNLLNISTHLKTKTKFNYKLYFGQISHRDVVFATKYNHRLNLSVVFWCIQRHVGRVKIFVRTSLPVQTWPEIQP